jgi:2-polyprenyl-6-methoxyphenol hydroxylase-like FAD-dependent oxidoreductase
VTGRAEAQARFDTDVIVVGGGTVGLMLAAELRLSGVDVIVLERQPKPSALPMPRALHARTLETLDRRGLLDGLAAIGRTMSTSHFAASWLMDLSDLPTAHPITLGVSHLDVVEMAAAWAGRLGARIECEHQVIGLDQDESGVTVVAETPGGTRSLRAPWAVGCDGGRSTVRRLTGVGFPGTGPTVTGLIGEVRRDGPADFPTGWNRLPSGYLLTGPGPTVGTFEFGEPPASRDQPATLDDLVASIRRVSGIEAELSDPQWIIRFTDNTRLADSYRCGRVLLAGDAAHVHFPAGAQGLNVGIQDAVNLGWKLAAQVSGWAPAGLLDSYGDERRPVARQLLDNTRAQVELMRPGARGDALRDMVDALMPLPEVNRLLAGLVSGVDIRYSLPGGEAGDAPSGSPEPGPPFAERDAGQPAGHPLVGTFAPDVALLPGQGAARLAEAMREGRSVLVELGNRPADRAVCLRTVPTDRLVTVWADPAAGATIAGPPVSAILVRPDGYVAWAAPQGSAQGGHVRDQGLYAALARWLGAGPQVEPDKSPALAGAGAALR